MRSPAIPDLPDLDAPDDGDAADQDVQPAPVRLHSHRRPAVQRKDLRAPLALREWTMLRRIAQALDAPLTFAVRHCIRVAFEVMFGPPTVTPPREDDAA